MPFALEGDWCATLRLCSSCHCLWWRRVPSRLSVTARPSRRSLLLLTTLRSSGSPGRSAHSPAAWGWNTRPRKRTWSAAICSWMWGGPVRPLSWRNRSGFCACSPSSPRRRSARYRTPWAACASRSRLSTRSRPSSPCTFGAGVPRRSSSVTATWEARLCPSRPGWRTAITTAPAWACRPSPIRRSADHTRSRFWATARRSAVR